MKSRPPKPFIPVKPARARSAPRAATPTATAHTADRFEVFAIAAPGFAPLIAAECATLGLTVHSVESAGVSLVLTARELFTLNCWTRLASRVLVRLATFDARDFATLERAAARVPWSRVLSPGTTVQLRVTCRKSRLYHSDAVAERVARGITASVQGVHVAVRSKAAAAEAEPADADANAVREAHARVRDDDDDDGHTGNEQLIVVRLERDHCTISADSSGALLHRRGWRQAIAKAPLRETLAAGMLAALPWNGDVPLVDPFCGSGTIGIEAALRARRIAPGLSRTFVMEQWPRADVAAYRAVRESAQLLVLPAVGVPIVLRDRDAGAIAAARANAERAGVLQDLAIEQGALSDTELAPLGARGVLLTNPPYGLRVSDGADLRGLYARLGDVVRAGGRGWQLGMLVPPEKALSGQVRLRLASVLRTTNGGLPVDLLCSS